MRISGIRKIITIILLCGILLSLVSCNLLFSLFEYEEPETEHTSDTSENSPSTVFNAIEVIISSTEKIILYKHIMDLGARTFNGYGEWICGETSEFVIFNFAGVTPGKKSDITGAISIFKAEPSDVFLMEYTKTMSDFYEINKNGICGICFGVNGKTWLDFVETEKPDVFVTVESFMRDQDEDWSYTPKEWKDFKNTDGQYRCDELNFWYDSTENIGEWNANGIEIPIRIEFLPNLPAIKIYDMNTGKEILYASGTMVDDSTLMLNAFFGDMFYESAIKTLKIKKC